MCTSPGAGESKGTSATRPSTRRATWIRAGVTLLCVLLLVWIVPWRSLWERVRGLDPRVFLAVLGGFAVIHAVGAFKWRLNVNTGKARLGALDALRCYWAGLFANLFLPSIIGGDALRIVLAGRITRRLEAVVFGSLADRLMDVAALVGLVLCGGFFARGALSGLARTLCLAGLFTALGALVLATPLLLRVRGSSLHPRLRRPVQRTRVAARRLLRLPGRAAFVMALALLIQASFVALNAVLGAEIGIELSPALWLLCWPLAKLVSLMPISLGGFGLREAALAGILYATARVPSEQGVALSLLWQCVIVSGGLLGGLAWLSLRARGARKPR